MIGGGWGTEVQIPAFHKAGFQISAIWTNSKSECERIAALYNIPFGKKNFFFLSPLFQFSFLFFFNLKF